MLPDLSASLYTSSPGQSAPQTALRSTIIPTELLSFVSSLISGILSGGPMHAHTAASKPPATSVHVV